jgi:hypothetical protein
MLIVFVTPMIYSAEQQHLGTFNKDSCIKLIQTCANCTYVNISSISYPNSSQIYGEVEMTKIGTFYNYSFCNTEVMGTYLVSGHGDLDGADEIWNYDFTIGPAYAISTATSIFYIGTIILLGFFFIILIMAINILPNQDPTDAEGKIMSINSLKYLRYPLGGLAWGILVIISFVIFNFAEGYLTEGLLVSIFRMFWIILMTSAMIGIPVIMWFMFAKFMQDQVIKKYIERGIM